MVDESKTGELDSVPSSKFKEVVDDCTLCDACFLSKCPYVPPHGLNIDFPRLMARYRAVENVNTIFGNKELDQSSPRVRESSGFKMTESKVHDVEVNDGVDRKLKLKGIGLIRFLYSWTPFTAFMAKGFSSIMNKMMKTTEPPSLYRRVLEDIVGIHKEADLPTFVSSKDTFLSAKDNSVNTIVNKEAKAYGKKKVLLFASCLVDAHMPDIGLDTLQVLRHNGVDVEVVKSECCGMPLFENGLFSLVKSSAEKTLATLIPFIDKGYDIVVPVSSCSLMFKKEWPQLLPENDEFKRLSENTFDVSEYIVKLHKENLLEEFKADVDYSVTLHHACHARSQSMGFKSNELLSLIPNLKVQTVDRCSGHGGTFGVRKEHHDTALKVGKPVFNKALSQRVQANKESKDHFIVSDCPLAAKHIKQGVHNLDRAIDRDEIKTAHPVQILARAYAIDPK